LCAIRTPAAGELTVALQVKPALSACIRLAVLESESAAGYLARNKALLASHLISAGNSGAILLQVHAPEGREPVAREIAHSKLASNSRRRQHFDPNYVQKIYHNFSLIAGIGRQQQFHSVLCQDHQVWIANLEDRAVAQMEPKNGKRLPSEQLGQDLPAHPRTPYGTNCVNSSTRSINRKGRNSVWSQIG
jgi:hypothetical protein